MLVEGHFLSYKPTVTAYKHLQDVGLGQGSATTPGMTAPGMKKEAMGEGEGEGAREALVEGV